MEYTKLDRTGLDVSRICLGCVSYGGGNALHQACGQIGRAPIPTRMSFRVEFSILTGNSRHSVASGRLGTAGHPKSLATC